MAETPAALATSLIVAPDCLFARVFTFMLTVTPAPDEIT